MSDVFEAASDYEPKTIEATASAVWETAGNPFEDTPAGAVLSSEDAEPPAGDMWSDPEPVTGVIADDSPAGDSTPPARRAPIDLEPDVKYFTDQLVTQELVLAEGKHLTPHALSVLIGEKRGGGKENRPSSGAVQATLKRWEEIGFATMYQKPFAFGDYTDAGRDDGLAAVKAAYSERAKAARAAAKAAAAPVTPTEPEAA